MIVKKTLSPFYIIPLLGLCLGLQGFAQSSSANLFYNNGDLVVVQNGAMLHVQGDVQNVAGGSSNFTNNGILNVEGDIINAGTFKTDGAVTGGVGEGTVRLIGNSFYYGTTHANEQVIKGFNGASALYNLVLSRGIGGQRVRLNSDIEVKGSLVWDTAALYGGSPTVTAATYTPSSYPSTLGNSSLMQVRTASSTFATPTGKALVTLYDGSTDYELYVSNGTNNSVAGYQGIVSYAFSAANRAVTANDAYIETRKDATVAKGFSRLITTAGTPSTSTYIFPVGGVTATYNPIKIYFKTLSGSFKDRKSVV